jgi:hypothetical protein
MGLKKSMTGHRLVAITTPKTEEIPSIREVFFR